MDNLLLALEASGIGVQQCWYVAGWISVSYGLAARLLTVLGQANKAYVHALLSTHDESFALPPSSELQLLGTCSLYSKCYLRVGLKDQAGVFYHAV